MGKGWDAFREALGDQVRGSVKYGASTSFRHNKAAMEAARAEREARSARYARATGSDYYSKYRSDDGKIHVYLDRNGNPTTTYPHLHVIHDERGGEVRIVRSPGDGSHPEKQVLRGNASGNEVNAAVNEMLKRL